MNDGVTSSSARLNQCDLLPYASHCQHRCSAAEAQVCSQLLSHGLAVSSTFITSKHTHNTQAQSVHCMVHTVVQ
jgi:hypothetical protein